MPDMDGKKKLEELIAKEDRAKNIGISKSFTRLSVADIRSISDYVKAMEAENERLRIALKKIVEKGGLHGSMYCYTQASRALAHTTGQEG